MVPSSARWTAISGLPGAVVGKAMGYQCKHYLPKLNLQLVHLQESGLFGHLHFGAVTANLFFIFISWPIQGFF